HSSKYWNVYERIPFFCVWNTMILLVEFVSFVLHSTLHPHE
uniref:Uncharacterized protein n=1 Tax=Aegilops tauschii subsp. strangulata TaxID=200361 RepID=A0A452YFD5_AEGTS